MWCVFLFQRIDQLAAVVVSSENSLDVGPEQRNRLHMLSAGCSDEDLSPMYADARIRASSEQILRPAVSALVI